MLTIEKNFESFIQGTRHKRLLPLRIRLWNAKTYDLGPEPRVTITVPGPLALRYLVAPDLMALGEAYVEGHIGVDGSLHDMFQIGEELARYAGHPPRSDPVASRAQHSRRSDLEAVRYHYDVSNDFYRRILGPTMTYSCAYFPGDDEDLDRAQVRKMDHILAKIRLREGQTLLDLGCGWGGLAIRAAQKLGARVVAITLSEEQYRYAKERVLEAELGERIEVRVQDYRDLRGTERYDAITSVGMFEHVGLENLRDYFSIVASRLKDGGVFLNHGITSTDPESRAVGLGVCNFINRYVFPNGELPHVALVLKRMQEAGLESIDVESLRRHYAKTTRQWAKNIESAKDEVIRLSSEKHYRIWSLFLEGCAHGFREGWMSVYQILAVKHGPDSMNLLPWSRDYMYVEQPSDN